MQAPHNLGRRHSIPVIYVRGTHYDVGFDVGRTFASLIKNLLEKSIPLNSDYIPIYNTEVGKKVYDDTLAAVLKMFPQYVAEVQGTADGAGVPFYKLFLIQMDDIIVSATENNNINNQAVGCSSICLNEPNNEILGHTEDALTEVLNHFYILSAHIVSDTPQGKWKVKEEKFVSLCYAGNLPGYTMGNNHHGLVYSINTLSAKSLRSGKIPRTFLTRALLAAENFIQAEDILAAEGIGAADGCSVNMTFLQQEGDRMFHNIEIGPAGEKEKRSIMQVFTASPGEFFIHCNKYLRLQIPEVDGPIIESSDCRMECLKKYEKPNNKEDVINMLSDQTGKNYRVFQEIGPDDLVKTIAVGIFDCCARTWTLYADKPNSTEPLVVLPLLKKNINHLKNNEVN